MKKVLHYIRYLHFKRRVQKNEFSLTDKEAADLLCCSEGTLKNLRSKTQGGVILIVNIHFIETFGTGRMYSKKALYSLLAQTSWEHKPKV